MKVTVKKRKWKCDSERGKVKREREIGNVRGKVKKAEGESGNEQSENDSEDAGQDGQET